MTNHIYKHPRLYLNAPFEQNAVIPLEQGHVHYLKNVLRKESGDVLRVFNGRDGEWIAYIDEIGKKSGDIKLSECFRQQPDAPKARHLYFSPIKKQRMDMLIEKAVELGVTDLHPVIMNRSVTRKINVERITAQMIEAAEQSERMVIPTLYAVKTLGDVIEGGDTQVPFYACVERSDQAKPISSYAIDGAAAFIIGPEGGFDEEEKNMLLTHKSVNPVQLGDTILRAETAAIACLSYAALACLCESEKN